MEQLNEQAVFSSHTEASEIVEKGETEKKVSYGKFKDLDALLSAYNSLEAEFTKRSQRLKELEGKQKPVVETDKQKDNPETENCSPAPTETEEEKQKRIIGDYIKSLSSSKPKAVVLTGGMATSIPQKRPKSIAEAGLMAKEIFNKD